MYDSGCSWCDTNLKVIPRSQTPCHHIRSLPCHFDLKDAQELSSNPPHQDKDQPSKDNSKCDARGRKGHGRVTYLQRRLIQFHQRDLLTQTCPRPKPPSKTTLLEKRRLFLALKPALRLETRHIGSINCVVSVCNPSAVRDFRAGWDVHALDHEAFFGSQSRE